MYLVTIANENMKYRLMLIAREKHTMNIMILSIQSFSLK